MTYRTGDLVWWHQEDFGTASRCVVLAGPLPRPSAGRVIVRSLPDHRGASMLGYALPRDLTREATR